MKNACLYRRRRLAALLTTATVAGFLYFGTGAGAEPEPDLHTVVPGDTLWEIATEYYPPNKDPRVVVEAIREENELDGYLIRPGQRLKLP